MTGATIVTLAACAAAIGFAGLAWWQRRDARERSAARVAALQAALDGAVGSAGADRPDAARHVALGAGSSRWLIVAGAVPLVVLAASLLTTRGARTPSAASTARQPDSLELLAMHSDRSGDALTVTGTVRVRGRHPAPVTAVVTARDGAGRIVSRAQAPLDDARLDVDGQSSFQVAVAGHDVRRYQVRFETPLGPLVHIDRRAERPAAVNP
jgi:hypothetical protein